VRRTSYAKYDHEYLRWKRLIKHLKNFKGSVCQGRQLQKWPWTSYTCYQLKSYKVIEQPNSIVVGWNHYKPLFFFSTAIKIHLCRYLILQTTVTRLRTNCIAWILLTQNTINAKDTIFFTKILQKGKSSSTCSSHFSVSIHHILLYQLIKQF